MVDRFLEAGRIVNTHGVRGEVKIQPWADSPEFLTGLKRLYIDGEPVEIVSAKVHKGNVIISLSGVEDIGRAMKLKDKIVSISKDDVLLEDGRHFIADIIGLRAVDADTGGELGTVEDVLSLPANSVYVIKGEREILVPAVPEFIIELDIDSGFVRVRLIEGM